MSCFDEHSIGGVGTSTMRILCFGGFFDYTIQLANALSQKEDVMLVLNVGATGLADEHLQAIGKKVNLCLLGGRRPLYHPANLLVLRDFKRKVNRFEPDIVHLQVGSNITVLALLPFFKRYPLIVTFHDAKLHAGEKSRWIEFIRYWERKCSDEIIVHGVKLKEQMVNEYNLRGEKVHVIHIGDGVAPFKQYEREHIEEGSNLILFFGRIYEYKGLEYLIKAEPMITKEVPNAKIVIAGAGENFRKYEQMMGNRGANFIVHNHRISFQEAAELFQRCNVVVLPYIDASQSGVVSIAYGFRKPVVVTAVGSIPEIVDDGKTGFVVPPRDAEALAQAIVKLLKDERLRKEMGESAYKKLQEDFSWERIAEKTVDVYKQAIEARRKGET